MRGNTEARYDDGGQVASSRVLARRQHHRRQRLVTWTRALPPVSLREHLAASSFVASSRREQSHGLANRFQCHRQTRQHFASSSFVASISPPAAPSQAVSARASHSSTGWPPLTAASRIESHSQGSWQSSSRHRRHPAHLPELRWCVAQRALRAWFVARLGLCAWPLYEIFACV